MTDYGHDLLFGTFLTPTAADAAHVVELARLSEQVGLDLVTVQDHPYQPRFLDTWTLLTWIAASTSRVRLAPNVANLPLRPPAVLARSAASLDLLSGGRLELGIGAGAFWDAIEANGGPRRTPGEAVTALEEAMVAIRALWAPSGGVRLDGEHYPLRGAKAGPAPAHEIGLWVGAYKPRMLRLVGRLADGWLPSAGYASPDALPAMNRTIDEAARAAGRDPAQVRRLYNIDPSFDADRLAALALEEGISGFVLAADDAATIRRFALVAEEVRETVAAARELPELAADAGPATTTPSVLPVPEHVTPRVTSSALGVTPTPDDGTRLSTTRPWDESTRPTGPEPERRRTYTAHEKAAGQHLVDVHDMLRGELDQVRSLVDQVAAGRLDAGDARSHINQMTMRQNAWTLGAYCQSYCRVVTGHHSLEDRSMLPHLRGADPRLAPVVDRLEAEHRVIHDVLEGVDAALVEMVRDGGDVTGLREAVDLLTDTLLSHLSYEERELVEPLARLGF
jgi:alkanesulfonate monooxygenase SsuD/methylene tetrahydromethanopterin reductase-like flavin-dependent oxidoreductase (luciferase family)/hemerythrin-like domain-containing protein